MNGAEEQKQGAAYQHDDDSCPNMEQIKKLKGEIKRLRLDLLKGGSSKRGDPQELNSDDSDLDEEEKKYTTVAIKEIKREIIEQDKLEEFKNECAVMEVIRHPNVVLFLGACTKQPNLCIILEYCSRGSLWSLLHDLQIKMNWEYRKKFAMDIAKGVYYLHTNKQPILHRDLKSLNVLLDHALNCKLADFGWTRILGKVMTSKIGTYQWMAPEVINGFKYTEKADVFSFGVILWELATRKPPYYGIEGQVVSMRVVKEGLRPKISEKEAPGPFLDLMKRCWHEDPDRRPSFGEIIKELDAMNFKNLP